MASSPTVPSAQVGGAPTSSVPATTPTDISIESRRDRHRRETFERLVRAAREIMFNRGFSDITVQDITDAADVGKGTFFNYFRSKEHIVTRVQEYNRRGLRQAVDEFTEVHSLEQALADALVRLLCPEGGGWLTYQGNTMRALAMHPDVRQHFSPELESNLAVWAEMMGIGQQQGTVRTDVSAADLAAVIQTNLAGLTVVYWIHGIQPTPALVSGVVRNLCELLAPPPQPPAPAPETPPRPPARRATAKAAKTGKTAKVAKAVRKNTASARAAGRTRGTTAAASRRTSGRRR